MSFPSLSPSSLPSSLASSCPSRRPGRRGIAAALFGTVLSLAVGLVGSVPAAHAAGSDPDLPFKADVPRNHQWREHTRLALDLARSLPGRNARVAHRLAKRNVVQSTPHRYRPYIHLGKVHHDRFTVTVVGDQACARWPRPGHLEAQAGPCTAADRRPFPNAAAQTATFLGIVYDRALQGAHTPRQRRGIITEFFSRLTIASLAWLYAPHGIGVAGVIDADRDGLDDDGRITLHGRGDAVCLRYAIHKTHHASYRPGICRNLAPREPNYPPGAGH